jgi:hypothetical protein
MYFREGAASVAAQGGRGAKLAALLCAAGVLVVGFAPGFLTTASKGAADSARAVPAATAKPEPTQHAAISKY